MLSERQKQILNIVIREYVKTAEPVGSEGRNFKKLKVSPATVRNEMKELEEGGYLSQPHTSAGRIPTEKGYGFFIENLIGTHEVGAEERKVLTVEPEGDFEDTLKQKAKILAQLTDEAVILSFSRDSLFYTGLTNLFRKPEFEERGLLISFSEILDTLDEGVQKIFREDLKTIKILFGEKNPFDKNCSIVVGGYSAKNKKGILGILGTLRMDYEKDLSLLKYVLDNL
jgi:heat-inducible transcriptional repressor